MSKYFFKYDSNKEAESLAQTLSLMFLMPNTSIQAEDVWASNIKSSRKIENYSMNELLTYTICKIKKVPSLTIVELNEALPSDQHLIELFQENYLGAINTKISKRQLVELATLQSNNHYIENLEVLIKPYFPGLKEDFLKAGLDDKECTEFKKLLNTSFKPATDWINLRKSNIEKKIEPLTKFIVRGF